MVDIVVKSSSLLLILINDVFDFLWLEDGSLSLEMCFFEFLIVLREVENFVKLMVKGKGLDFFFDINMDVL